MIPKQTTRRTLKENNLPNPNRPSALENALARAVLGSPSTLSHMLLQTVPLSPLLLQGISQLFTAHQSNNETELAGIEQEQPKENWAFSPGYLHIPVWFSKMPVVSSAPESSLFWSRVAQCLLDADTALLGTGCMSGAFLALSCFCRVWCCCCRSRELSQAASVTMSQGKGGSGMGNWALLRIPGPEVGQRMGPSGLPLGQVEKGTQVPASWSWQEPGHDARLLLEDSYLNDRKRKWREAVDPALCLMGNENQMG